MKIVTGIITALTLYTTQLNDIKTFNGITEIYYNCKSDSSVKVNNLTNYIPSIYPLNPEKQKRISSQFGSRYHPVDKKYKMHYGIDISAKYGTPIHATASGKVIFIKASDNGYGKQIKIKHEFGFFTKYAHLHTIMAEENQFVQKGEVIGFVGSSGKSTGSHIHYEIEKNNKRLDPLPFCKIDTAAQQYYNYENLKIFSEVENEIDSLKYGKKKVKKEVVKPIEIHVDTKKTTTRSRRSEHSFGNMEEEK